MFTVVFMNWLIKENIPLDLAKLEYHATIACSQLHWIFLYLACRPA